MALAPGTRLGVYEVTTQIGAGGMGEVYQATDTNLKRSVAIKVLPASVAGDEDRLARFQREAEVLAALNHPNIGAIYGLEKTPDFTALVMELVEGDDLSQRIGRGAIPIDEALPIAKQIAEALDAAHEQGIIHRDLKPANIKVRADGQVKVLDFGLAKAIEPVAGSSPSLSMSPTIATPAMTQAGIILGTAAYMSPEQARGKTVDKRADIWAFGCVLYEMLSGSPPFHGETLTDVVAAVIKNAPDWSALPVDLPVSVRTLVRRCLQKDATHRLRDVADVRIQIEESISEPPGQPARSVVQNNSRWTSAIPWTVAALVAIAMLAMQGWTRRGGVPAPRVTRLELNLPNAVEFNASATPNPALSADGTRVAFVGMFAGTRQVYVRRFDQSEAVALNGTETAMTCFFSPDGAAVGFISSDRTIRKVSLADGLVVTLAREVDTNGGGAWGSDDRIVFGRDGALWQVAADGGSPHRLTTLNSDRHEVIHAWPTVVGGDKAVLFTSVTGTGRDAVNIEALSLATGTRQVLERGIFALYTTSGHLIFSRDGALLAVPFDVDRLRITGPPVRLVETPPVTLTGVPLIAASNSGTLVYPASGTATSRLVWVSRQGVEQAITDTSRPYQGPRVAGDGRRIVVNVSGDLWIQDTARATFTRLTSEETIGNAYPVWTPDGRRIVFRTLTGFRWISADGSERSHAIPATSGSDTPSAVSPDGATLAFVRPMADTSGDIYVLSLHDESKPHPVVATAGYDGGAQFSPDGRWMAYASNASGRFEVFVRPFPGPGRIWPVSTQGGTQPHWSSNGRELFYRSGNRMLVVDVSTTRKLSLSTPRVLFEQRYAFGTGITVPNYDVSSDGQRFLMVKDESGAGRLNVVLNWHEELKRLVPTK